MEKVYTATAEKFQGRTKKKNKKWLREETRKAIDQRQMIHDKIHCTKSERRKKQVTTRVQDEKQRSRGQGGSRVKEPAIDFR